MGRFDLNCTVILKRRSPSCVYFLILISMFLSLFCVPFVNAFSPKSGTPLFNRSHPRLHLTQEVIPGLRQVIPQSCKAEYQKYVNWAASASDEDQYNVIDGNGHDILRAFMVHQAFIAVLGQVAGISYPISLQTYADRAIARLINRLNRLLTKQETRRPWKKQSLIRL